MTARTDSRFGHEERESSHHSPGPAVLGGVGLLLALLASMVAFAPTVSAGGGDRHDHRDRDRDHEVTVACHEESGTWSAVFRVKNWKGGAEGYTSFDDETVLDGRHMRVTAMSSTSGTLSGLAVGDVVLSGDRSTKVTVSGIPISVASVSFDIEAEWRWYTVAVDASVKGHVEIDGKSYAGLETKSDARTMTALLPEGCVASPVTPEPDVIVVPPVVPALPAPPAQPGASDDDAAVGGVVVEAGVESEAGVAAGTGTETGAGVQTETDVTVESDSALVGGIGVEAGAQAGGGTLPRTGGAAAPLVMAATALIGLGAGFRAMARRLR
jgi:hypothetical protein